jgi:putative sterol carrier protein
VDYLGVAKMEKGKLSFIQEGEIPAKVLLATSSRMPGLLSSSITSKSGSHKQGTINHLYSTSTTQEDYDMTDVTLQQMMEHMSEAFVPDKAVDVNAVVQCRFTGAEAGEWVITIRDGKCAVETGTTPKPQLTLTMDSQDYKDLAFGTLNGMTAFMQGKIKLSGDIALAMKFTNLFKIL